jgi:hypothetical protein
MSDHDCLEHLCFQGHLAAPGKGTSWECTVCHEDFWSAGCGDTPVPFEDLHPSTFELQPWEVI